MKTQKVAETSQDCENLFREYGHIGFSGHPIGHVRTDTFADFLRFGNGYDYVVSSFGRHLSEAKSLVSNEKIRFKRSVLLYRPLP